MAKILIADDDKDISRLVDTILSAEGHTVIVAPDGNNAMALAIGERPDLILLDKEMPDHDGYFCLLQLRKMGTEVPIIMLTGHKDQNFTIQCFRDGADDFISKPFDQDYFILRIKKNLMPAHKAVPTDTTEAQAALRSYYEKISTLLDTCPICERKDSHEAWCEARRVQTALEG